MSKAFVLNCNHLVEEHEMVGACTSFLIDNHFLHLGEMVQRIWRLLGYPNSKHVEFYGIKIEEGLYLHFGRRIHRENGDEQ